MTLLNIIVRIINSLIILFNFKLDLEEEAFFDVSFCLRSFEMEKVKLMNMCKIVDPITKKILVQERRKSWKGIAFPGGKIEIGESIVPSVKREIYEETGLKLNTVRICGIKDWYDKKENERQLVILFVTEDYTGDIIPETDEGKVYWIDEEKLKTKQLADDFDKLLNVFNEDNISEMVYEDNETSDESSRWILKLY